VGNIKKAVRREKLDKIPMALIIDSRGFPDTWNQTLDYFLDPELWFQSNLKIMREFPDIISSPRGGWNTGCGGPSYWGKDQILAGTIRQRVPHALPPGRHRQLPEYEVEADGFAGLTCTASGWRVSGFWMPDTFCPW